MGVYQWKACPHCGVRITGIVRGAGAFSPIGEPFYNCHSCSKLIATGCREWGGMTSVQQKLYWLRVAWWCFGSAFFWGIGGVIVGALVWHFILKTDFSDDSAWFSALFGAAVGIWLTLRGANTEISLSNKRVNRCLQCWSAR